MRNLYEFTTQLEEVLVPNNGNVCNFTNSIKNDPNFPTIKKLIHCKKVVVTVKKHNYKDKKIVTGCEAVIYWPRKMMNVELESLTIIY